MNKNAALSRRKPLPARFIAAVVKYRYMYLMLIPGLIYILVFHYAPMGGLAISFQDFKVSRGVFGSKFIGFENYAYLLKNPQFQRAMRNTFIISLLKIGIGFPIPILLALLINEIRVRKLQRLVQTILYLPHFLSWVIMFGLVFNLVKEFGPLNHLIRLAGGKTIFFLSDTDYFRGVLVVSDVWKEMGWNAIIYLAALAGVSQDLYEAAVIDGASRIKCLLKISLPSIMPTIVIMFILRIGGILNVGFEQVLALYNPSVFSVGDIIDTYVFRIGLQEAKFGISAAAGMFKSIIAAIMVISTNHIVSRLDQGSLF